jgi:predicted transcriptional regulator
MRIMAVWDLNQADAARAFGVSRQAISKWCATGVPADRADAIAELAAATDLLVRHLRRDRIAGVVRRAAPMLDNQSLLGLLQRHEYHAVLQGCRAMFQFAGAHH